MPRQHRIQYPGAIYHVMARGNRRENIVHDDADREMLLATLAQACQKTGWEVLAWVIMDNHYHWLLRTPKPNLVAGMSWFQSTYTQRYNARHRLWGHLFGGRYKAIPVQGRDQGGSDYLTTLMDYVHLNPVRAGLVKTTSGLGLLDYPWSSLAQGYGLPPRKRSNWLKVDEGLKLFGLPDTAAGRRKFIERLEQRVVDEKRQECGLPPEDICRGGQSTLRRGWFWGGQAFEEWLRKAVRESGAKPEGRALRTTPEIKAGHDEDEAERIVAEGLKALSLTRADLESTPGSEPCKVAIAWAVHQRTAVRRSWTAERLWMKSAVNVTQQIKRMKTGKITPSKEAKQWLSTIAP